MPYKEFAQRFGAALLTNRFLGYYFRISALIIVILGILVWVTLCGILFGFLRMALIVDPAYQLARKLLLSPDLPSHLPKPPLSAILFNSVSVVVISGLFIVIGVRGLYVMGFWSQNVMYALILVIRMLVQR